MTISRAKIGERYIFTGAPFAGQQRQPAGKKRSPDGVAGEHGFDGGLDEEYLFSSQARKGSSEDETGNDEHPFFGDDAENDMYNWKQPRQDWRSTHEDVLNKIKRDREAYQQKLQREKYDLKLLNDTIQLAKLMCSELENPCSLLEHQGRIVLSLEAEGMLQIFHDLTQQDRLEGSRPRMTLTAAKTST
nr:hypothetical protein BaRGS_017495 [Batillaria attramentaria]